MIQKSAFLDDLEIYHREITDARKWENERAEIWVKKKVHLVFQRQLRKHINPSFVQDLSLKWRHRRLGNVSKSGLDYKSRFLVENASEVSLLLLSSRWNLGLFPAFETRCIQNFKHAIRFGFVKRSLFSPLWQFITFPWIRVTFHSWKMVPMQIQLNIGTTLLSLRFGSEQSSP